MQVVVFVAGADRERVRRALEAAGCEIVSAAGPLDVEHVATAHAVDAVVFDPNAVDQGLGARLRARKPGLPQIAWLASSSATETAALLASGSDEVVNGGMGDLELAARVRAAATRGAAPAASIVEVGALSIDPALGEASWEQRPLPLTRREREVLLVLAESPGRPIPRDVLYRRVWGYAMARGDRTVDVNVKRLRSKLATATGSAIVIVTQTGVGYRLDVVAAAEAVTTL